MTREECLRALEEIGDWPLWDSNRTESGMWEVKDASRKEYELIEKLITEHFDNPPLSFDELEKGMWVWDDKNKLYVQIDNDFNEGNGFIIIRYHEDSYNSNCERVQFEENRFYRRQKED